MLLKTQVLGGRSRQVSEFEASLAYKVNYRTEKPYLEKTNKKRGS